MIWGGARAKVGKKTQRLLARGKKTQLNNLEETQLLVGQEKKLNTNSLPEGPPISLMVRPLE